MSAQPPAKTFRVQTLLRRCLSAARERPELLALALIVGLGAGLRFATLGLQSYRYDEAVTAARVLQPSLFHTLGTIPNSESNPPLYYFVAWFWSRLFGVGPVGLRSLSALAGSASVLTVYAGGATLVNRRVGLIAAAIVAVNPVLVWFSQDARPYALVVLLTSLSFLCFARIWVARPRAPSGRDLTGWAVFSALALATHYFSVFVVLPEAALLLLGVRERRGLMVALAAIAATGLALLPLALHQVANNHASWIGNEPLGTRLTRILAKLTGDDNGGEHGRRVPGRFPLALHVGLAVAAVAMLAALADRDERRRAAPVAAVALSGVLLPLALAAAGLDYLVGRNMLAVFVPLIVLIAAGFGVLRARRAGLALAACFCLLSLSFTIDIDRQARYQREDLANAARQLGADNPRRAIVTIRYSADWPLIYYRHARFAGPHLPALREIDLIGSAAAARNARRLLPPGFHPAGSMPVSYEFTLTRFRARRPQRVALSRLRNGKLVGGSRFASVLLDQPG